MLWIPPTLMQRKLPKGMDTRRWEITGHQLRVCHKGDEENLLNKCHTSTYPPLNIYLLFMSTKAPCVLTPFLPNFTVVATGKSLDGEVLKGHSNVLYTLLLRFFFSMSTDSFKTMTSTIPSLSPLLDLPAYTHVGGREDLKGIGQKVKTHYFGVGGLWVNDISFFTLFCIFQN